MSVIIKNLDMPIGCQKCKFFRKHLFGNGLDYSYSCILGAKEFPMPWIRQMDERAVDCPLIETNKEQGDMKRYIAILEIEDDSEIVGDIEAHVEYTYRVNDMYYRTDESIEFKAENEVEDGNAN